PTCLRPTYRSRSAVQKTCSSEGRRLRRRQRRRRIATTLALGPPAVRLRLAFPWGLAPRRAGGPAVPCPLRSASRRRSGTSAPRSRSSVRFAWRRLGRKRRGRRPSSRPRSCETRPAWKPPAAPSRRRRRGCASRRRSGRRRWNSVA
ncbi:unnamed protein product, partial [Ectocarpus sp. 12 AP-2014]